MPTKGPNCNPPHRSYAFATQKLRASTTILPAGGGGLSLAKIKSGLFANDQPRHSRALGSDRRVDRPLTASKGWLSPAGAEVDCSIEAELEMTTVEIDADLLAEMGAFDPVLQALLAHGPAFDQYGVLYSRTMQRALVAQFLQGAAPRRARHARHRRSPHGAGSYRASMRPGTNRAMSR